MNIYILRHGETEHNSNKYYYGNEDVSLSNNGIEQMKKAHMYLKNIDFGKVYCSEKKRAKQSIELVINKNDELIIDKRLNERNFGVFEGKSYKELKDVFPEEYILWEEDWINYCPKDGESHIEVCNRVFSFVDDVLKGNEENILICTHAGVMRGIYCYLMDKNIDAFWKFGCSNGDLALMKYEYGNLFLDSIIPFGRIEV